MADEEKKEEAEVKPASKKVVHPSVRKFSDKGDKDYPRKHKAEERESRITYWAEINRETRRLVNVAQANESAPKGKLPPLHYSRDGHDCYQVELEGLTQLQFIETKIPVFDGDGRLKGWETRKTISVKWEQKPKDDGSVVGVAKVSGGQADQTVMVEFTRPVAFRPSSGELILDSKGKGEVRVRVTTTGPLILVVKSKTTGSAIYCQSDVPVEEADF